MYLSRIHIDPRCKEARRDLSDLYQLHSTLCRAFVDQDTKCPAGEFLWRLEPETDAPGCPRVLVQSRTIPDWSAIPARGWLAKADPAIELADKLKLDSIKAGQRFRFRLRANPCVTRDGKRLGLLRPEEQERWLSRKGQSHGFSLPGLMSFDLSGPVRDRIDVRVSHEQMLKGNRRSGGIITVFSVLYDGVLAVSDPARFIDALRNGVGHGKVMGLGLMSVAPIL